MNDFAENLNIVIIGAGGGIGSALLKNSRAGTGLAKFMP